jgi:hypothetical protein
VEIARQLKRILIDNGNDNDKTTTGMGTVVIDELRQVVIDGGCQGSGGQQGNNKNIQYTS